MATIIDAHIHCFSDSPLLLDLMEELDLKFLNICVSYDDHGPWRSQAQRYKYLADTYPDRFAWCTSFDLPRFSDENYARQVIDALDQDFEDGAVACKIWKNIGMEVLDPSGEFIMPDHPILDPIYDHLAGIGRPLLGHIGEPLSCWLPLDSSHPHFGYYSENPEWHMYGKLNFPSHEQIMAARDNVMVKHPKLRFIGAHLGSLEYDVDVLSAQFARFPNFAVDISARLLDLAIQNSAKVRKLFLDWPDRILFGVDVEILPFSPETPQADRVALITDLNANYATHFAYLESEGIVQVRDRQAKGLALPEEVLEQVYRMNAEIWYPGV